MEAPSKDQGLISAKNPRFHFVCDLYSWLLCRNQECVLIIFVAIGCALGGVCRYLLANRVTRLMGEDFPWGTLVVNALGSFLLGVLLGYGVAELSAGEQLHGFAAIGFCGGLTTFSTFSLQALTLVSQQRWKHVVAKVFGSLLVCMLLVLAGFELGERLVA